MVGKNLRGNGISARASGDIFLAEAPSSPQSCFRIHDVREVDLYKRFKRHIMSPIFSLAFFSEFSRRSVAPRDIFIIVPADFRRGWKRGGAEKQDRGGGPTSSEDTSV